MKSQTKNSKPITNGKKITQRNPGQRQGQQKQQSKVARSERAPVAIGNKTYQSGPRYLNKGENFCVSHREYIADITGSTSAFAVSAAFPLNPGMASTFPWLSQIASRYESYKFIKCKFLFKTERPTTESGYVALVPDFDASDPQPTSKSNAFQYESTAKSAPWENVTTNLRGSDLSKRKTYYVRQGALNPNESIDLYDTGNLFVCVGGNSGAVTLGELWCEYEVCFMTPQIDSNYTVSSAKSIGAVAQTPALPLGTTPVSTFGKDAFFTYDPSGGSSVLLFNRAYQGLFELQVAGTGLTSFGFGGTAAITIAGSSTNSGGTLIVGSVIVQALPGQTLALGASGTTVTAAILRVGDYSYALG